MNWLLVFLSCMFAAVSGMQYSVQKNGTCNSVTNADGMKPFDLEKYAGEWYEISRLEESDQKGVDCVKSVYTKTNDPTSVLHMAVSATNLSNRYDISQNASAEQLEQNTGLFKIHSGEGIEDDYRVLGTDYEDYAVIFSCRDNADNTHSESATILSKKRVLSSAAEAEVKKILAKSPIDAALLRTTEQDEYICTNPTACIKTIAPVQENFDAVAYLGKWYEISRSEKQFESNGDCVTAEYSSGASGLVVNNAMTILKNRTDSSIQGTAKLANDKGNPLLGLLKVSFNVNGVQTDSEYRILSTDYKTYSIVYSCKNNQGSVSYGSAWVLSRDRVLSTETKAKVKELLAQSPIASDLLRTTEQDEYICTNPTACDKTIAPVQENFKLVDYLGDWYEISRYEAEQFKTNADCVAAQYTAGNNGGLAINSTMTVLENRTTISIEGTAKLSKGDPVLGLLKVSFPENGVSTDSEYRILSTDYKTYSIVYSCTNNRGKISYGTAKILSRSRDLKNFDNVEKIVNATNIELGEKRNTEQDEATCNGAHVSQTTSIFLVLTTVVISYFVKQ